MAMLILRRVLSAVVLLWIVSVIVFLLTVLIPGDPALTLLGDGATPETLAAVRESMGLNDPLLVRYWHWLSGALTGDLGDSLFMSYSVSEAIGSRIGVTVSLVGLSVLVSTIVGIAVGMFAGARIGSWPDRVSVFFASIGIALPNFWLGILLATFFGVVLGVLPAAGYVPFANDPGKWALYLILPVLTLSASGIAEVARQARASMADTLQLDFIRTLHAKGVPPRTIRLKHALRNAMIPILTVIGLLVSRLFAMSVLVEAVFGLPGLGSLLVSSVFDRDIPMIQGVVLVGSAVVIIVNELVDALYGVLNPKTVA